MKRKLIKRFWKKRNTLIICFGILLSFVFMSNGYSILDTTLNITGTSSINLEQEEEWIPDVEYLETKQMENVFFYDIIIHNNSENTYQNWEIKMYDNKKVIHAYEYGESEDGYRIIRNTKWDNRIEKGGLVTVTIIFSVNLDKEDTMTAEEYAKYYVENYIKVSGRLTKPDREGDIIKKGNASLTLRKSEIQVTNFNIRLNPSYETEIENERQYIIDITNDTDYDFKKVRANVYLGDDNILLEVSPSEIT